MFSSGSPVGLSGSRTNINIITNANMQQSNSFSAYGERPQLGLDVEYGTDPASGAIFKFEGRKHDDLKQMLDSNKDGLKLEAMKRIIGMIARGRDASDLFPAVVKNVVSKNIEVKKLVYVYLVRYAEEQQDLALLSISTFQRALKDPNQLIRASALRVLSSIRVSMIVPIVMLAIRDSASDMSPYVRKTAAHAIPKLYSLDAEQKDELVTIIEKLLSDRTTLVVGSAVMAFEEVCPERVDLIHKNYRKLCNLLVDVDEWGQVIIINMLTRYARTQFINPNIDDSSDEDCGQQEDKGKQKKFYDDDDDDDDNDVEDAVKSETDNSLENKKLKKPQAKAAAVATNSYHVDLDHRLLLRQTKPLLQSRNASVVMAVAQLYHHVAPRQEVQIIAKALIRLLRSHKEVQSVVLTCIASMSTKRKTIFESYIKSFFVRTSDPTHIKLLKLEILTNLAAASTISLILREFQTYISNNDRSFVAATIQAIGRCAASIKEITETCLNGLVHLLSHRDEHVVAESVVVIKKLLQTKAAQHHEIITQMAKLLDFVKVPAARAAITWLIGEFNEKVSKIAPDVLRKMAKTFVDEEDAVKLQVLNLAVKLYLTNPQQTSLLCQYVFSLARYDINYDIRDRARFLKQFIFPVNSKSSVLSDMAKKVFLVDKPAPTLESRYYTRNNYQLGSLSHYLNIRCTGYNDLPDFPMTSSDASVRNVEGFTPDAKHSNTTTTNITQQPIKHSKNEQKSAENDNFLTESDTSTSSSSSGEESNSVESDVSSPCNLKKKENNRSLKPNAKKNSNNAALTINHEKQINSTMSDSDTSYYTSGAESDTSTGEGREESEDDSADSDKSENADLKNDIDKKTDKSNLDLLLDLDDIPPMGPVMTPSLGGFLTPGTPLVQFKPNDTLTHDLVGPSYIAYNYKELLNKLQGHGLQVSYRYTRSPHLYSSAMVSIELQFINHSSKDIENIKMGEKVLASGMRMQEFPLIQQLMPNQCVTTILGVNFNDSTHAIEFEIYSSAGISRITFKPIIGELVRAVKISETMFKEERINLRGMNEHQSKIIIDDENKQLLEKTFIKQKIFEIINVACIGGGSMEGPEDSLLFSGQTMTSKSYVLITCTWELTEPEEEEQGSSLLLQVNCEKMVIGSMVLNELKNCLKMPLNKI